MLSQTLKTKLEGIRDRLQELELLLAEPDVIADQGQFRKLGREHAELEPVAACYRRYQEVLEGLAAAREMLEDADAEMRALAAEEVEAGEQAQARLEQELERLLLPRDPADDSNLFLEIRAGTGGDEAALFAGDLLRMYGRYAERCGWRLELVSASHAEVGGYKEVIARIEGRGAYARLKFESGVHRVQRVPQTESQGRIHTSACTVAVLPELEDVAEVELNPGDLRVDTFRASGAGGQHVNKTDSAIRITHLPSGLVVECQDERSQHKNRARALALLQARLHAQAEQAQRVEQAQTRRALVGSGDRSERIRTYNFPQGRITDHRINLTLYKLEEVLAGNLDPLIEPLSQEHQLELLAALEQ